MSLTQRILIAMGLGLVLGALSQWIALPQEHVVNVFVLNGVIDAAVNGGIAKYQQVTTYSCQRGHRQVPSGNYL